MSQGNNEIMRQIYLETTANEDCSNISDTPMSSPFAGDGKRPWRPWRPWLRRRGRVKAANNEPNIETAPAANEDVSEISGTPVAGPFAGDCNWP